MYTPKHGSWLKMAEIELNVLTGQCLKRRIDNIEIVKKEAAAWQKSRNNKKRKGQLAIYCRGCQDKITPSLSDTRWLTRHYSI